MVEPRRVSTRLIQVLRVYCHDMNPRSIADLRASIASGGYPWLRQELHTALAHSAFTPATWLESTSSRPRPAESDRRAMRRQQRQVWGLLFPGHAYPTRRAAAQSGTPVPPQQARDDRGGGRDRRAIVARPARRHPDRAAGAATPVC